uniref:Uncharacterized protein n=1 Tax=Siphoviridae sp. ctZgu8 TaxID=2827893 RepID=A0A8S5SKU0_9CAUD|nr:MAG TPA: hypothetical protein [Siphoviridae sp. ctZgu8]DAH72380.1 MAG TPA: hypothetical protein [Caudoviricetes sp.]
MWAKCGQKMSLGKLLPKRENRPSVQRYAGWRGGVFMVIRFWMPWP